MFLSRHSCDHWEILIDTNDPGLDANSRFAENGTAIELVPLSLVVCRVPEQPPSFQFADSGSPVKPYARRFPVGAEVAGAGVHFRVWAPRIKTVDVVFDGGDSFALEAEDPGYFSGFAPHARAGSRYKYKLDGGEAAPDPASRFQPDGPHG